jgi:hypothetical protein
MDVLDLLYGCSQGNISPVLHVNGDDAEAVVHAMSFALISECNLS